MKPNTGAQFEISVAGVPRSYRDVRGMALEGAEFLKATNPRDEVAVRDLETGDKIIIKSVPPTIPLRR